MTSDFLIRNLNRKTKATLEEMAKQRNQSLNKFIVSILELVAKDNLTLETLETLHFTVVQNTDLLYDVKQLLENIKGGVIDAKNQY